MKGKKRSRRFVAWLLSLVMILTSMGSNTVYAAGLFDFGQTGSGTRSIAADALKKSGDSNDEIMPTSTDDDTSVATEGVTRQADPNTMDTYTKVLDFTENTKNAGRLWTDKTVFANNGDGISVQLDTVTDGVLNKIKTNSDFLHVYSALGSSQELKGVPPARTVIVFDNSGSMYSSYSKKKLENGENLWDKQRIAMTIEAINKAIDKLMMKSAYNEVSVVLFGDGGNDSAGESDTTCYHGNNTAVTILPMKHYTPDLKVQEAYKNKGESDSYTEYLTGGWNSGKAADGAHPHTTPKDTNDANIKEAYSGGWVFVNNEITELRSSDSTKPVNKKWVSESDKNGWNNCGGNKYTAYSNGYTSIQAGLYQGMQELLKADKTATVGSETYQCIPSLVMLSDGAVTDSLDNWLTPTKNDNGTLIGSMGFVCDFSYSGVSFVGRNDSRGSGEDSRNNAWNQFVQVKSSNSDNQPKNTQPRETGNSDISYELVASTDSEDEKLYYKDDTYTSKDEDYTLEKTTMADGKSLEAMKKFADQYGESEAYMVFTYLLTASYYKEMVRQAYNVGDEDDWNLYTVTVDMSDPSLDNFSAGFGTDREKPDNSKITTNPAMMNPGAYFNKKWLESRGYLTGEDTTFYDEYTVGDEVVKGIQNAIKAWDNWKNGQPVAIDSYRAIQSGYNFSTNGIKGKIKLYDSDSCTYEGESKKTYDNGRFFPKPDHNSFWRAYRTQDIGDDKDFQIPSMAEAIASAKAQGYDLKPEKLDYDYVDDALYAYSGDEAGDDISDAFDKILNSIMSPLFQPVSGSNDLAMNDSVTYVDPIGKYMEVKNVEAVTLFGETYKVEKVDSPTDEDIKAVAGGKKDHTDYTIYRVIDKEQDKQLVNYSYGDGTSGEAVKYKPSDIHIWVEKTGDYDDTAIKDPITTDNNYDQALWIDIPVEALPVRTVSIDLSQGEKKDEFSYADNIGDTENYSDLPLRVFYSVGMAEDVLTSENTIDLTSGKVSPEYVAKHKSIDATRGVPVGNVEFFSNWYNDDGKDGKANPVSSFSPNGNNRYYRFTQPCLIYEDRDGNNPVADEELASSKSYFVGVSYYDLKDKIAISKTDYPERKGNELADIICWYNKDTGDYSKEKGDGGNWVRATMPGSLRVNDEYMKTKAVAKTDPTGETKDGNFTYTASNFYQPTVNKNGAKINTYLGNNGRLYAMSTDLLVTKTVQPQSVNPEELMKGEDRAFRYKVKIGNYSGKKKGIVVLRNGDEWQKQYKTIDLLTTNDDCLKNADGSSSKVHVDGAENNKIWLYTYDEGKSIEARFNPDVTECETNSDGTKSVKLLDGETVIAIYDPNTGNGVINGVAGYMTRSEYLTKEVPFNNKTGTYDFELKDGEGLLFTGMPENTEYTVTEQLSQDDLNAGYGFHEIKHIGKTGENDYYGYESHTDKDDDPATFDDAARTYSITGWTREVEEQVHYVNSLSDEKEEMTPGADKAVKVGDEITYTIDWNNPNVEAADVTISDEMDNGVDFVSASILDVNDADALVLDENGTVKNEDATQSITLRGKTVTWNLVKRNGHTNGTVKLVVKVNENAVKYWNYDGNGTVSDDGKDDYLVRNQAIIQVGDNKHRTDVVTNPVGKPQKTETNIDRKEETAEDVENPNLTEKENAENTKEGPLVYVGDQITYEVEWRNYKSVPAFVTVTDTLDKNVEFVSASFKPGSRFKIDSDGNKKDSVTEENPEITVEEVSISSEKTSSVETVNKTTSNENGESVTGPVPVISYDKDAHSVTWNLGTQPAGVGGTVTIVVKVLSGATQVGKVENKASVEVDNDGAIETEIVENPVPDAHKTEKTPGDKKEVAVGKEITYKVSWKDFDYEKVDSERLKTKGITVTDPLDPGVDLVDAWYTMPGDDGETVKLSDGDSKNEFVAISYDANKHTVTWKLTGDAVTKDGFVSLRVRVTERALLNSGEVDTHLGNAENNPTQGNWDYREVGGFETNETNVQKVQNRAVVTFPDGTVVTELVENPLKDLKTETDPGDGKQVQVNDEITYKIDWMNLKGEDAYITVKDRLDPGVNFVSASFSAKENEEGVFEPAGTILSADETKTEATSQALDADGKVIFVPRIKYDASTHTVIWNLGKQEKGKSGSVMLTVRVNGNGADDWKYTEKDNNRTEQPKADPQKKDYEVWDRAGIQINNDAEYFTNIVENPMPGKTEVKVGTSENPELKPVDGDGTMRGPSVYKGEEIRYGIHWKNGEKKAAVVTITDKLDKNVDFVSAEFGQIVLTGGQTTIGETVIEGEDGEVTKIGTITYGGEEPTVTWNLGKQEAGAEGYVYLTVKVKDNITEDVDEVKNQATVTVDNTSKQTNWVENPVGRPEKSEVAVENKALGEEGKIDDPKMLDTKTKGRTRGPEVFVGDEITYKVTWKNYQTEDAEITISDELSEGLDYDKEHPSAEAYIIDSKNGGANKLDNNDVTINYDETTHTITWNLGRQASGAEGYVTFKATVNDKATPAGMVDNKATVTVDNDSVETNIVENPIPNPQKTETQVNGDEVEVSKGSADNTYVGPRVKVGDTISYEVSWDEDDTKTLMAAEPENRVLTITDPLDLGVDFVEASYGELSLIAQDGNNYSRESNDKITIGDKELPIIKISYDKTKHTVTWTLRGGAVTKKGSVALKVKVTKRALTGADENIYQPSVGDWGYRDGNGLENNGQLVQNRAVVTFPAGSVATDLMQNPLTPQKEETKPGDGELVGIGEQIIYQIHWQNYEATEANVKIKDPLDPGVDFESASENGVYDPESHTVTWDLGEKEPNETGTVTLTVRVRADAAQKWNYKDNYGTGEEGVRQPAEQEHTDYEVFNRASVKVGNNPYIDTNIVENPIPEKTETSVNDTPTYPEDFSPIEGAANGDVEGPATYVDKEIVYEIRWKNGAAKKAAVTVTDPLDKNVEFVSAGVDGVDDVILSGENVETTETVTVTAEDGTTSESLPMIKYDKEKREVTWNLGVKDAGAEGTVTLTVRVLASAVELGQVENQAKVKVGNSSVYTNRVVNPVNKPKKTEQAIDRAKGDDESLEDGNLQVEVQEDGKINGPTVYVGDVITYRVTWKNYKKESANVKVIDTLGKGLEYVDKSAKAVRCETTKAEDGTITSKETSIDGTVTYDKETNKVTIDLGRPEADAEGYVEIQAKVTADAEDSVVNEAVVTVDIDRLNTNDVENPVPTAEKKEVTPGDGKGVKVGEKIDYTVSWNSGQAEDEELESVIVTDPLDPGVKLVSASYGGVTLEAGKTSEQNKDKTILIEYNADTHTVVWTLTGDAAVNEGFVNLSVEVTSAALTGGETYGENANPDKDNWNYRADRGKEPEGKVQLVQNRAVVTFPNGDVVTKLVKNPLPPNKTEKDPGEDLLVGIGEEITYEIEWQNYKDETATVVVKDPLDPGVDFVSATDGGTYDATTHTVTWNLGEQETHAYGTVTLVVKVNENAKKEWNYGQFDPNGTDYEVVNRASMQVDHDPEIYTDVVENPVPDKTETQVGGKNVNLAPKTDADGNPILEGPLVLVDDEITYTIGYRNTYDVPATVTIIDPLDKGVDFVSASYGDNTLSKPGELDNETVKIVYNADSHTVTWTLKNAPANTAGTVTLVVKVNRNATPNGKVDNQATVTVGNSAAVDTEKIENPTPVVHKTEVEPGEGRVVTPGKQVDYKVTWRNYQDEAADVVVTDNLDPGVYFLNASIGGVKLDETTAGVETGDEGKAEGDQGVAAASEIEGDPVDENVDNSEGLENEEQKDKALSADGSEEGDNKETVGDGGEEGDNKETVGEGGQGTDTPNSEESGEGADTNKSEDQGDSGQDPGDQDDRAQNETEQNDGQQVQPIDTWSKGLTNPVTVTGTATLNDGTQIDVKITYNPTAHQIKWELLNVPAGHEGDVDFSVIVNENAYNNYTYNSDGSIVGGEGTDDQILNQAGVQVGQDPNVLTEIVENPLTPEKDEKQINGEEVSGDVKYVDENGIVQVTPTVKVGDKILYTISWVNNSGEIVDVKVTDILGKGLKFSRAGFDGEPYVEGIPAGYGLTVDEPTAEGQTTVTWTIPNQVPTADGLVWIEAEVTEEALKIVHNDAWVEAGSNGAQQLKPVENHLVDYGDLTVSKIVTGEGDTTIDFNFTVTLSDDISGTYGDMTFANGVASFTLKHGESKTAKDLPAGITYEVTEAEANQDGYTTTADGASGTIPSGGEAHARFTNNIPTTPPPGPGPDPTYTSVTVNKVWVGDDPNRPASVKVQLFRDGAAYGSEVTLDASNNWRHTWSGLPETGNYTVNEVEVPKDYSVDVAKNGETSFTITNTYAPDEPTPLNGTLNVTKKWVGDNKNVRPDSVLVQLYKNNVPEGDPVELNAEDDWSYSWTGLDPNAEYTVREVNVPEGYEASIEADEDGINFTITNTYDEPDEPNEDIPDTTPPLANTPGEPSKTTTTTTTIPNPNVPLTSRPSSDSSVTIEDTEVPLGDAPKTGDETPIALWMILVLGSLLSAAMISRYLSAKRREQDKQ